MSSSEDEDGVIWLLTVISIFIAFSVILNAAITIAILTAFFFPAIFNIWTLVKQYEDLFWFTLVPGIANALSGVYVLIGTYLNKDIESNFIPAVESVLDIYSTMPTTAQLIPYWRVAALVYWFSWGIVLYLILTVLVWSILDISVAVDSDSDSG